MSHPSPLSADKQTLLALRQLRQRVEELETAAREPIAIVGMACRYPGDVSSPEDFWSLLEGKRDAIGEIPRWRIDLEPIFTPYPAQPGRTYSRWAGLLDRPDAFDAEFFGIAPREAAAMDPQQRLLLEVSWEALEDAGINPKSLAGVDAGVFLGISASEYGHRAQRSLPPEQLSAYTLQGTALNAAAGRLAYFYGFSGPAVAIDTACSSSLVAVDRACRSLRDGESRLALAAGVNLVASAEGFIIASQWGMLSPRGICAAFDDEADGFVRGEGCGVVVLKRLRDAEAAGDRVLAVILGSAVNQDGASSGLTVPNGLAQQALLREAHHRAGIEAHQVGYIEAHGTGTKLGDPIEAEALGAVFSGRQKKLAIGSVKASIGHLESAAGVAGLIKLVLSLEHEEIPGQVHWQRPSSHVRWEELPLEVITDARALEPIEGRRIGGVSSFGFSGTNAHLVVEARSLEAPDPSSEGENVLVMSARTELALRELAERYSKFLATNAEYTWAEICHTAGMGRAPMSERLAVVAGNRREAAGKLQGWLRGEMIEGITSGHISAGHRGAPHVDAAAIPQQIAEAWAQGANPDWEQRRGARHLRRAQLPKYPFQRERYWIEHRKETREIGDATGRGMLGRRLRVAGVRAQYETRLQPDSWIGEHEVEGEAVLPATGHIELMLEAGADTLGMACVLEELVLQTRLEIAEDRRVQVTVEEEAAGRNRVRIYAEGVEENWERVAEAWLRPAEKSKTEGEDLAALQNRLRPTASGEAFYAEMATRGMRFGERFRGVERIWSSEGEALGEISWKSGNDEPGWQAAPWWLDACLQVVGAAAGGEGMYLPASVERVELYEPPGERSWSYVRTRRLDDRTIAADVTVFNADGSPLARLSCFRFRKVTRSAPRTEICTLDWKELEPQEKSRLNGHWLILCDQEQSAFRIKSDIQAAGGSCTVLPAGSLRGSGLSTDALEAALEQNLRDKSRSDTPFQGIIDIRAAENSTNLAGITDPHDAIRASARALHVLQVVLRENVQPALGVWLMTAGGVGPEAASPAQAAVWAIARTASVEFPDLPVRCVDIGDGEISGELLSSLARSTAQAVSIRGGRFFQSELVRQTKTTAESGNPSLRASPSGLIDLLEEVPVPRREPRPDEVEIRIEAHGINFRDVLTALAMLPVTNPSLGGECAGSIVRAGAQSGFRTGDRVFAFAPHSLQPFVTVPVINVARIPEGLTAEQASALPIVYLTAIYGLDRLASLQRGETVLIHAAAGGLGLAALHLAKARGAEVYATAGTDEKRDFLRKLGVQDVFSSRTGDFANGVLQATGGRGVDVVLNSLTGDLADKNLSVLAPRGRLLEVGKRDMLSVQEVRQRRPDAGYFIYDLGEEAERDATLIPALMADLLRMMQEGSLPPLPVTSFADAREALRYMAQARHIGKIVVTRSFDQHAKVPVSPHATYLITGGCGGLGLIFAESLVSRGARNLMLMGRREPSPAATAKLEEIRSRGVQVDVFQGDVADRSAIEAALAVIPEGRPLKGILHLAGVLDDRSLLLHDQESLLTAMRPKWLGAWNLHQATALLPLDFFILFSSAVVSLGSPGQVNYVAANATLDALSAWRKSRGLPALSVQWGPWAATGMAEHLKTDLEGCGLGRLTVAEGVAALDRALSSNEPVVTVLPITSWRRLQQWQRNGERRSATHARSGSAATLDGQRPRGITDQLRSMAPADRSAFLREHLRQQAIHILSLPESTRIDQDEALHDLGLDSLMAVELRNALAASLGQPWSPTMALDYPTLQSLTEYLLSELFSSAEESQPTAQAIENLSEAEAEELLLQELGGGKHDAGR
jgi:phthiocerol/phenolphthiocerol synthesis type-I polyketide synthase C